MELHPIFVKGFSGLSYPEKTDIYSDAPYKIWRNISNRIDIPINFFQGVKGTFVIWKRIEMSSVLALIDHGRIVRRHTKESWQLVAMDYQDKFFFLF